MFYSTMEFESMFMTDIMKKYIFPYGNAFYWTVVL